MAVSATMRANELADVRFVQAQKIADLEKRLAVIEPIVKRVPKLEEDYAEAIKSLAEALDREKTKDLLIEQLELKIEKLEEKVGRYEGADEITGDDTRPLIVAGDILGDGTSGRDSGSRSRDGDDSSSD
jgi:ABC-type Fe3+-hydroxamate transport system substrate-binding protein